MLRKTIKNTIGRITRIDLPKLGFAGIEAKVDTGAYYCSLYCHSIKVRKINGEKNLCFCLLDPAHPKYKNKEVIFKEYASKIIKNSFGKSERRFVIRTAVRISGKRIKTYITLTKNRGSMKYPMLIGRRLLKNKFMVDVSVK